MKKLGYGRFEDPDSSGYIDFSVPRDIAEKVEKYIESLLDDQNFWDWVEDNYADILWQGLWRNKKTNKTITYQEMQEEYNRYEKETIN